MGCQMTDNYEYESLRDELTDSERTFSYARRYIRDKVSRIRRGVYDEPRDGNLLEVLEEIERILR